MISYRLLYNITAKFLYTAIRIMMNSPIETRCKALLRIFQNALGKTAVIESFERLCTRKANTVISKTLLSKTAEQRGRLNEAC